MARLLVLVLTLILLVCVPVQADTIISVTLLGSTENPPNASPGIGTETITLNTAQTMLTVNLSFSGLTAPASAAHIHCCAGPAANAAVVLPFTGFPSATSGTYNNTFTLATDLVGITPATFLTNFFSNLTYTNIHNTNFPGGEIRGQIIAAVPEPGTWLLLGSGIVGMLLLRRKKVSA
jgi:hypothetical protein